MKTELGDTTKRAFKTRYVNVFGLVKYGQTDHEYFTDAKNEGIALREQDTGFQISEIQVVDVQETVVEITKETP